MSLLEFPGHGLSRTSRSQQEYERAIRLGRLVPREVVREVIVTVERPAPEPEPIPEPKPVSNVIEAPIIVARPYAVFRKYPTFEDVIHVVANFYGVRQLDIKSKRRPTEIVKPRQIVMFMMRELTEMSFPEIGRLLGNRDHTTALYGAKKIKDMAAADERLRDELDLIKIKISELMAQRNALVKLVASHRVSTNQDTQSGNRD